MMGSGDLGRPGLSSIMAKARSRLFLCAPRAESARRHCTVAFASPLSVKLEKSKDLRLAWRGVEVPSSNDG